ncbi:large low complexity [Cryptosporidium sp. chipmunk genotype I]|uniref:large low complexity n=1 Tax=Cryptosporidium sp. chipmunk genotype I TaxID=1280935 RepID=UPI00351A75C4|nr:large low complexity [Cryptosporidium sp. chipmunk genotype I]
MHFLEADQENKSGPIKKSMGEDNQANIKSRPSCPNIEDELRAISIPCKSSNLNYIKVMCEKALLSFRHYRDVVYKTNYDENGEIFKQFPVTDVCSVFREAIMASTKNPDLIQLSILGMNCIQQILIPGLLDTSHKITILAVLNEVTIKVSTTIKTKSKHTSSNYHGNHSSLNNDKEQVLLKVIQTVLLFLSPEILEFNEPMITLTVSIISTLFNLSGYYQLIQMSQLAIRQLINISLDYIDSSTANKEDSKEVLEVVPLLLIKDISIMIDKNVVENVKLVSNNNSSKDNLTPLSLLKGGITIPSEICLDLWYEILDKNTSGRRPLLENNEDLRSLIHNVLFPTLTKCIQNSCLELNPKMSQNIHHFVMFARFIRLFVRILEFNSSKKLQGPFIKDCICNSLMSFIQVISDGNYTNIPSWSLQCILEMLSELVQNPDILIIIGNYNVKVQNKEKETDEEPKTTNILELIIFTINQILVSFNDQLDILYSAENALNLSVPSFLNEKISLPSILLPQHNNTSIECGYFIIGSSKKTSEKNLRLIDVIMEDDRIYHISKYYCFGGNYVNSGVTTNLHAGNTQSLSNLSSVVLISLKPIEISLLVFDIILNISTCLNRIYKDEINGDREKMIEFEKLVFNIWDQFYILIKQCMDYYLLRYYVYRIITFLFMISNLPELKGKLSNILELIFESLQKYYKNNQILESRILSDTVMLEKLFSIYKCFLSISYQFSECLDEVSWQLLFRYMEYIDRILDIGLGPMVKSSEIKSKYTIEVLDLEEIDQGLLSLKSEQFSSVENGESIELNNVKAKDEKIKDGQIIKTLMAESTILRASHQVFIKDHIKNISENTMNSVIKGIYKELSYNMYKENLDIQVFDYMLKQLSCIIQSIYDKMSYNLFIPIWNDKIIPLLLETIKQNNYHHTGIACAQNQDTCNLQNCMQNNDCPHKNNDLEINKNNKIARNNVENVGMFNSIMNFLSSTITTIFQFADEDNSMLMENNVQTSLLSPYLMLTGSFPMYNTLLLRSLYSILCSTIPKLDDSTWILINLLINNIIQERYRGYIKYLKYERSESNENIVINGSLSFLESSSTESLNYESNQIESVNLDIDYDIELLQALFSLIEYITDEAEIRFLNNTNKISSSWNLLIESIAVFGRVNISTENMAFQAVSLLWKLTDLIGASLSNNSQEEIENELEQGFNQRCEYEIDNDKDINQIFVFDQRNVKINMNKINKVYYSDYTNIDIIWLNIILQLEDLCKDPRQEIRNCSLRTLFSALITHCKYIKNQLLKSIIVRILGNVLTVSIDQYNNSYKETNYEKLRSFYSLSKDDNEYKEMASLSLLMKDSEYVNYNSMNSSLEFEKSIPVPQNHDSNPNKLVKQDDSPSLSTSFIRNSQQNKLWEGTLIISIDGALRVIKELSQNNLLKNQESKNICYECTMFLYKTISSLLFFNNEGRQNSAGFENHHDIIYTKDIQITSIKTLYELLVLSMRIGDKQLWNSGFKIYKEIIDRITNQSAETLRKLQRAEEFIHNTDHKNCKDDSIYKLYNNYVHKLIKFYLSDKLAESLLQSVVDLLILIKNEGNMVKYIVFDESFTQLALLLDLIISIITSTDTFIHHTVPLSNLNYPDFADNFQNTFEEFNKKQFIDQRSKQGLYRNFCEYYKSQYGKNQSHNSLFLSPISSYAEIWGRDKKDPTSLLYIPKLVNFEKDNQETVVNSFKDSNNNGRNLNRLIYIDGYNNSDFIHSNCFKKVGDTSLLKVFYQEKNHQSGNQLEDSQDLNVVYLLRNINNVDMFRPDVNYCYYFKSKQGYKAVTNPIDKRNIQEKSNDIGTRSYLCSIKNNNDYLSSSINGEIRFITTIQNIGMEALQFYMMSLLSFDKIESNTLEEIPCKNLLIPLVIKKLLDTLIIHRDLFVDTNKIGISSKTISLLVGFNRNVILKSMEIIQLSNIIKNNSIIQIIMILPYIFEKLLLIMELDKDRIYGIWMVAKEALLIIMHDWISFIGYLKIEFVKMNRDDLNSVNNEFNQIIMENIWPLFIDIIGNMVKEDQGFGLKVVSNNILNKSSQKMSNYIDNYYLYFDILLVNVVMDFILILNGFNNVVNKFEKREKDDVEELEIFELPYKYYKIIINYFDEFINDNKKLKNGLELRNKSLTEEYKKFINVENTSFGGSSSGGNNNISQNNHPTLNVNYQTLKIYIIEKLFVLYDQLNIKLSPKRRIIIKISKVDVSKKEEGEGEQDENILELRSKVRDLINCIEELGDKLHRLTSNMFKSFSMEDLQSGLRPMPHLKIEEMHSLLVLIEKHYKVLRRFEEENLDDYSGIQLEILRMQKRCFGNYIENVLPELIECVTCKDQSIRQRLKSILSILSRDISKDYNSHYS